MKNKTMKSALVLTLAAVFFSACVALAETAGGHFEKARRLESSGKSVEAIAEYQAAVKSDPGNAKYRTALGYAFLSTRKYDQALEAFTKAVELSPDVEDVHLGLGLALNATGQHEKSIEQFKIVLSKNPDNAVVNNNIGQNYYLLRQFDEAEKYLNKAISIDPGFVTAYVNLGNIYTEENRLDDAVSVHKKAIALDPNYALVHNNLAFVYFKKGDLDAAIGEMKKARDIDPGNDKYRKNFDFLTEKAKKQQEETAKQPVEMGEGILSNLPKEITRKPHPENEEPVPVNAEATEEPAPPAPPPAPEPQVTPPAAPAPQQNPPAAASSGAQPIWPPVKENHAAPQPAAEKVAVDANQQPPAPAVQEKVPAAKHEAPPQKTEAEKKLDQARADFLSARYETSLGNYDRASHLLDQALAVIPDDKDGRILKGILLDRLGDPQQAASVLRQVLVEDPTNAVALNALGHTDYSHGDLAAAESAWRNGAAADPADGCVSASLGALLAGQGNCSDAYEALGKAIAGNCGTAPVLNNLAFCEYRDGDMQRALNLQRRALELAPGDTVMLENYSFLADKAETKPEAIRLTTHPYAIEQEPSKEAIENVSLARLVPVDALDFVSVFKANWKVKTILVVPPAPMRGTQLMKPNPIDTITDKAVEDLGTDGWFSARRTVSSGLNIDTIGDKKILGAALAKQPSDLVVAFAYGKTQFEDREHSKYFGLKKTGAVLSSHEGRLVILDGKTKEVIYDGDFSGGVESRGLSTIDITARLRGTLRNNAFDAYCDDIRTMLLERYNLLKHPLRKDMVRVLKTRTTFLGDHM